MPLKPIHLTRVLLWASPIVTSMMVLMTYVIAASLHHVPWFLPMISDCQTQAPEKYLARFAMPLTTFFQQCVVCIMYIALSRDPVRRPDSSSTVFYNRFDLAHCLFGIFVLCGFFMVGAISEDSDGLYHVIGAVAGFWGLWLYSLILTIRLWQARVRLRLETWSLLLKALCIAGCMCTLTALGVVGTQLPFVEPQVHTVCAILEWASSICLAVFQFSLVNEVLVEVTINPLDPGELKRNVNYEFV